MTAASPESGARLPVADDPVPWAAASPDDPEGVTASAARALFTRVTVRANFAGFPFRASASPETRATLAARARAYAARHGFAAGVDVSTLPAASRGMLAERMLIPARDAGATDADTDLMLFPGVDPRVHALAGGSEHWTAVRVAPGRPPADPSPWFTGAFAPERDRDDAGNPLFARSSEWGLLTSDPSWAGNGLQVEAGVHLPALAASQGAGQARRALSAMGFVLEPLSPRDPGAAEAGYFRVVARGGLGQSREEQYARFAAKLDRVLEVEAGAWTRWRGKEPRLLEDRMHRALAVLRAARRLEGAECLLLCSYARCGVYEGLFPAALLAALETLRVRSRPGHVAVGTSSGDDPEDEAARRADLARSLLTIP